MNGSSSHGEPLLHEGTDGELISSAVVIPDYRDDASLADQIDALIQNLGCVSLQFDGALKSMEKRARVRESDGVNAHVGAVRRELLHGFDRVLLGHVHRDDIGAYVPLAEFQTVIVRV